MLAASLIRAQGIDVLALFFETPFFTSQRAEKSAKAIDIPFKVINITERHLKVVKNPKHGHGGNMNPCIDCHALMFRIAGEMLEQEKAGFIVTGEVLGQRPMSQNRTSLNIVASESGYGDLILRPLSAKCLPPTTPEEKGWVKRELLMDFQGRTRKPQMEMARELNIKDFPTPAGGCLLTEKGFSRRLKDLLTFQENPETREMELLKLGRHFRISPHAKLVVGRNKKENEIICSLSATQDIMLTSANRPGPTVLGLGDFTPECIDLAAAITAAYSDSEEGNETTVRLMEKGKEKMLMSESPDKEDFKKYML
jgi:tRNA U34 2-thiouridine synthase MnmA/TrmU